MHRVHGMHGEMSNLIRFWPGNLMRRGHMGDLGMVRRIIMKWIFKK